VSESKASQLIRMAGHICLGVGLVTMALLSVPNASIRAQNGVGVRKLVYKVAPKYPRELKQNEIGGIVRLSVSINPNGSVGRVTAIGGDPVLVDAASVAVKQWRYVAADHATTTEVQLDFVAH